MARRRSLYDRHMSGQTHAVGAATAPECSAALERAVAEFEARLDELALRMADQVHAEMPEFGSDARVTAQTLGAVRANLAAFARVLRGWGAGGRPDIAPEAVEYVRAYVRRGVPLPLLLRSYRLGHAYMWRAWLDIVEGSGQPTERRFAMLEVISDSMFRFIDAVTAEIVEQYLQERERWVRSAEAVRVETVQAILAGDAVDVDAASRALGYELRRWHVALVLWDDGAREDADRLVGLRRAASEVAEQLGVARPLLLGAGSTVLWAWVGMADPPAGEALAALTAAPLRRDGVSVALSGPAEGIDGFRCSHEESVLCRRVMKLTGARDGAVQRYSAVAVLALLTADLQRAHEYVRCRLGPLLADDDVSGRLRATLSVYLDEGLSPARTARRLGIHQNTVMYRIRRCEELLGRPVRDDRLQLELAVLLRQKLGMPTTGDG
jgi:DNA-binding PucR family transcriptional regulator